MKVSRVYLKDKKMVKKMENTTKNKRQELRNMLKAKITEKQIQRSTKDHKEQVLDKTLKNIGIDKEKFKKDLEELKKQGGLKIDMN